MMESEEVQQRVEMSDYCVDTLVSGKEISGEFGERFFRRLGLT